MSQERLSPPPISDGQLIMRRIVDPPNPQALLDLALARIETDGSVLFDADQPEPYKQSPLEPAPTRRFDDTAWAYKALAIATTLFQDMRATANPEYTLSSLARYLTAFRHDPALLQAAVSLIVVDGDLISPPQNATADLLWRDKLAQLRSR